MATCPAASSSRPVSGALGVTLPTATYRIEATALPGRQEAIGVDHDKSLRQLRDRIDRYLAIFRPFGRHDQRLRLKPGAETGSADRRTRPAQLAGSTSAAGCVPAAGRPSASKSRHRSTAAERRSVLVPGLYVSPQTATVRPFRQPNTSTSLRLAIACVHRCLPLLRATEDFAALTGAGRFEKFDVARQRPAGKRRAGRFV